MVYSEGEMQLSSIKVFYRAWKADDPKAVICGLHGFAENSSRYSRLGEFLSKNGFSFFMYDLRGHGKTAYNTKDFGYIDNFDLFLTDTKDFLSNISRETNKDIILFGHSMGGLIALHYIARIKDYVSYGITSGAATVVKMSIFQKFLLEFMNKLNKRARVNLPIKASDLTHDRSISDSYINDPLVIKRPTVSLIYNMYLGSKQIWEFLKYIKIPMLMLHGGSDNVVPSDSTKRAFELISSEDKEIRIYPNMYHEILNEQNNQQVYDDILNWISVRIK